MRLRRSGLVLLLALGAGLSGCAADGSTSEDVLVHHPDVPFTYRVPSSFTAEGVDWGNSRGAVKGLRALDKVNVIAVRRLPAGARVPKQPTTLRVLGEDVTSEVTPLKLKDHPRWAIECQYTDARRAEVRKACRTALGSVKELKKA